MEWVERADRELERNDAAQQRQRWVWKRGPSSHEGDGGVTFSECGPGQEPTCLSLSPRCCRARAGLLWEWRWGMGCGSEEPFRTPHGLTMVGLPESAAQMEGEWGTDLLEHSTHSQCLRSRQMLSHSSGGSAQRQQASAISMVFGWKVRTGGAWKGDRKLLSSWEDTVSCGWREEWDLRERGHDLNAAACFRQGVRVKLQTVWKWGAGGGREELRLETGYRAP